VDFIVII